LNLSEVFIDKLAHRPYCSNSLERGLSIRDKTVATEQKYIQANQPSMINWLCFDVDYPGVLETTFQSRFLPAPNFLIENPVNHHSHLIYGLVCGVCSSDQARMPPLNYLAAVEYGLRNALRADDAYAGLIIKNPLHNYWNTYEIEKSLWTLSDLSEYLTLPKKLPDKAKTMGLGRNCTLFEVGRKYAYQQVSGFRQSSSKDAFFSSLMGYIQTHNTSFMAPLSHNECKNIAKSICNWTWKNYLERLDDAAWQQYVKDTHTSAIQSRRGKKSGQVRFEGSKAQLKPWVKLGISRAWYYRQQKNQKISLDNTNAFL